jgi:hypothetical protein
LHDVPSLAFTIELERLSCPILGACAIIPTSDTLEALPRFNRLAHTLQDEGATEPIFEQLSATIGEKV